MPAGEKEQSSPLGIGKTKIKKEAAKAVPECGYLLMYLKYKE